MDFKFYLMMENMSMLFVTFLSPCMFQDDFDAYKSDPESLQSDLAFPYWMCQPYVRPRWVIPFTIQQGSYAAWKSWNVFDILQWQIPGLESTWKWKKVLENPGKIKVLDKTPQFAENYPLSHVINSVWRAFPSFFLRNLEIQQLLYTCRTIKLFFYSLRGYTGTGITVGLGKINFVLKNSWVSPGKIFNLFLYEPCNSSTAL